MIVRVSVSAYKCVFEFVCECLCICNTVQWCECVYEDMCECACVWMHVFVYLFICVHMYVCIKS